MASSIRTVSIQVPPNACSGDTLTFVLEGKELECCVPVGCQPYDVLEIHLEVGEEDDNDVAGGRQDTEKNFGNEKQLSLVTKEESVSEMPPRRKDENEEMMDNNVTQIILANGQRLRFVVDSVSSETGSNITSDGTHRMIWPTTRLAVSEESILKWILGENDQDDVVEEITKNNHFPYRNILELGAGLGCLGLALASELTMSCLSSWKHQPEITLTDCAEAMANLVTNVDRNRSSVLSENSHSKSSSISIQCATLEWQDFLKRPIDNSDNKTTTTEKDGRKPTRLWQSYDLIIGSDLLYNTDQIPALAETVNCLLNIHGGTILILVRWRKPELERTFFALTEQNQVEWKLETHSQFPCEDLDWKLVGDPNCEQSNYYFGGMVVGVGGIPKPLKDIDETDVSRMTTAEYDMWERAYIQVYRGRRNPPKESVISKKRPHCTDDPQDDDCLHGSNLPRIQRTKSDHLPGDEI